MARRWKLLALALGAMVSPGLLAQVTTYEYTDSAWENFTNFTSPCAAGTCTNYPLASHASGYFTTAVPLPPNMVSQTILPLVTSFSFTDGINTYASSDPATRVGNFAVATDSQGRVQIALATVTGIFLEHWQSGSSPHAAGDRFAVLSLTPVGDVAGNNIPCSTLGTAPNTGATDTCDTYDFDPSSSGAINIGGGAFSHAQAALATPTLSGMALAILALLTGAMAAFALRRTR